MHGSLIVEGKCFLQRLSALRGSFTFRLAQGFRGGADVYKQTRQEQANAARRKNALRV
jgi:hypothetical protein